MFHRVLHASSELCTGAKSAIYDCFVLVGNYASLILMAYSRQEFHLDLRLLQNIDRKSYSTIQSQLLACCFNDWKCLKLCFGTF